MLTAVAVITSLVFVGWLVFLVVRQLPVRSYTVARRLAYNTGIYTFAFFLSIDHPKMIKVLVSILLGAMLIFLAAYI